MLSRRHKNVLFAVVTEFIETGEPVGSRTLVKKHHFELSPATIRNVLAELEELGYLRQPHTSAGRIPTEQAFRLYISGLSKSQRLAEDTAARIESWLEGLTPGTELLRSTGRLLSELAGAPALVARRRPLTQPLRRVRFIPTRPGQLLGVLVFADGTVENRFIEVGSEIPERELERLHALLEEVVAGRGLADVHEMFRSSLEQCHGELSRLEQLGLSLFAATVERAPAEMELVVEGQSRLFDQFPAGSSAAMKDLLRTLDDRKLLVALLDRTLASKDVRVFLGDELGAGDGTSMGLVVASYHGKDGEASGAVGVLGPTRMDYPLVVPLVSATAEAVGAVLTRPGSVSGPGRASSTRHDE